MATKPKAPAAAPPSTAALDTAFGTCRDVDEFEKLNRIGEGTYGTVYRARDKVSGEIVALKRVILHNEKQDGFPITAIREIKLLKRLHQENCVQLKDVVVGRKRSGVFLVFEYCEHDLSALLSNVHRPFTESEVKRVLMELLRAVEYLHAINIIHRDLKLSNILYDGFGRIKLADFGLARETGFPSPTSMTPKVVTLWYRAPELLLGAQSYSSSIDIWACGCIFGELILNRPLLNGSTDLEQLQLIYKTLGRPTERIWPGMSSLPHADKLDLFDSSLYVYNHIPKLFETHLSAAGLELLQGMLTYDPSKRITASSALRHPYFDERPFPKEVGMMPTFPSQHDDMPPPPPPPTTSVQREDHHFGRAFGGGHQVVVGNKKRKIV
ncbi:CMGC/CDK protein kinase, variant 1, partial [Aphanomyces astaci]